MKRAGIALVFGLFLVLSSQAGADSNNNYVVTQLNVKSETVTAAPAAAPAPAAKVLSATVSSEPTAVVAATASEPTALAFTGGDVTGMLVLAVMAIGAGLVTWRFSVRRS